MTEDFLQRGTTKYDDHLVSISSCLLDIILPMIFFVTNVTLQNSSRTRFSIEITGRKPAAGPVNQPLGRIRTRFLATAFQSRTNESRGDNGRSRGVESLRTIKLYLHRIVCDKRVIL